MGEWMDNEWVDVGWVDRKLNGWRAGMNGWMEDGWIDDT